MNAGLSKPSGISGRPEPPESTGRPRPGIAALALALGFALVASLGACRSAADHDPGDESGPTTEAPGAVPTHLSEVELKLVAAYREALQRPEVLAATRTVVAQEVRRNPPLALVRGYWTTGVDLNRLFNMPEVRDAVGSALEEAKWRPAGADPRSTERRLRRLTGLAFTPHQLRKEMGVPQVDHLVTPEPVQAPREIVFLVLTGDEKQSLLEYLPPDPATGCYYFCGDPEKWDFDGDGVPNRSDDDDDGDGVDDRHDAFPYWRGASSRPRESVPFVGFTEKFSDEITVLILTAFDRIQDTLWSDLSPQPGSEPETTDGFYVVFP